MPDKELRERMGRLELEFQRLRELLEGQIQSRAAAGAGEDVRVLRDQVASLTSEKEKLLQSIDQLQAERLKPTPSQLVQSFRVAMDELRASLQPKPGDRVGYTVSHFDVDLKTMVTVDKKDQVVRMVLPEPGETIPAHLLSNVRFVFQTVPKPEAADQALVEVPTLLGLSKDAATKALERVNLKLGEQAEQVSSYPPGAIIGQDPQGGDQVPAGSSISVVIARVPQVKVPVLVNLKLADAQALIEASNLTTGTITEEPSTVPSGTVIGQTPGAGTLVDVGTPVNIVVAKTGSVVVPNLVGHKEEEAPTLLSNAKLSLGQKTTRPTAEGVGTILEQDPMAGVEVAPGTAVNLVIGVADTVKVPDLRNLGLEQAKATLEKARLRMGSVTARKHRTLDGVILAQEPEPGKMVPAHTLVNVVVAQRLSVQDVLIEVQKHPDAKELGIPLRTLEERLATAQIDTPDKLMDLVSRPDARLRSDLGLPTAASARFLRKALKESWEKMA